MARTWSRKHGTALAEDNFFSKKVPISIHKGTAQEETTVSTMISPLFNAEMFVSHHSVCALVAFDLLSVGARAYVSTNDDDDG